MGSQTSCEDCKQDPATKACQDPCVNGLDVLAPSPVYTQTFGLPVVDEYGFTKTPMSSASDWQPIGSYNRSEEFRPAYLHGTENIAGQPVMASPMSQGSNPSSRAAGEDPMYSPSPSPNASAGSPQSGAAPFALQSPNSAAGSVGQSLEQAPTPMEMQPSPSPVKDSTPEKQVIEWRRDVSVQQVLEDTCWCWYCFCQGCGYMGQPAHPKCTCDTCVCKSLCETVPCCSAGCCQCVNMVGCCTCMSEFPPQESPCVLCWGDPCLDFCPRQPKCCKRKQKRTTQLYGDHDEAPSKASKYTSVFHAHDACFCCCCGCGNCGVIDCCEFEKSCCCHRCECGLVPDCCNCSCNCLATCATLYGQCWCPPKKRFNPCCALCGVRCCKRERDKKHPHTVH